MLSAHRLPDRYRAIFTIWSLSVATVFSLATAAAERNLAASSPAASGYKLHVPSPDWRDQIIYFLMTDRFNDGDPSNNDQGAGEYDPMDSGKYRGGDLRGVEAKVDYIKGLGATAIWITPPVGNLWWDPRAKFSGYHGYWAENFMAVDKHLGTLDDYRRLSHRVHTEGMYLVQDIVLNHTGNYFYYDGPWDRRDPAKNFKLNPDLRPFSAPTQKPFDLNDARNPDHRNAGIYHWTPDVTDYKNRDQELNFQMSGLDDLNTENPLVRRALRLSYAHWIREVGVDAFRVDTAFYVPPEFFSDFLFSPDTSAPGVVPVAKATGRDQFYVFGEGFGIDRPYQTMHTKKIERYMTAKGGRPILPGMLNFPLYGAFGAVFARGQPTAELGHRIRSTMQSHARPHLMATFVDNHDVDRFLAGGSVQALEQSLLAMMTLPGVPVIYYGTEQGFKEQRAPMFRTNAGASARDHFDQDAPLYRYIARISAMRKGDNVFTRGRPTVLRTSESGPGVLAYTMTWGEDTALIVMNTAEKAVLLDRLAMPHQRGTILKALFGIGQPPEDMAIAPGGTLTIALPGRAGFVWKFHSASPAKRHAATGVLSINPIASERIRGELYVSGRSTASTPFALVVDGDLSAAQTITPTTDGRWRARVDTSAMIEPSVRHRLVAWRRTDDLVSNAIQFRAQPGWQQLVDVVDPEGDDWGPTGRYIYPTEQTFVTKRPLDMRRIRVLSSGGSLRLEVTMKNLSTSWSPPNGFDHVVFTVFLELPGKEGGTQVMPLQNGSLPSGMSWHYRLRAHGWSNALFTPEGASATNEGTPTALGASILVDHRQNRVSFVLPSAALGGIRSVCGAKIYVTTWDYDEGYRPLNAIAAGYSFGGAGTTLDPLVMDDSAVLLLDCARN